MEIFGIGIDLVDVGSIKKIKDINRMFTDQEISYCKKKMDEYVHFAGRYAAKEAVYKGLNITQEIMPDWTEIEIVKGSGGTVGVHLSGNLAKVAGEKGIKDIKISITHTKDQAMAAAILVR